MNNFWWKFVRNWTSYCNHVTYIYVVKVAVPTHHLTSIMVKVLKVHELSRFFLWNVLRAVWWTINEGNFWWQLVRFLFILIWVQDRIDSILTDAQCYSGNTWYVVHMCTLLAHVDFCSSAVLIFTFSKVPSTLFCFPSFSWKIHMNVLVLQSGHIS